MNTRNKTLAIGLVFLTALVMLALVGGFAYAQGAGPGQADEVRLQGVAANAPGAIPIQGRLTDASGNPLNGVYTIKFNLYEVASGGTAVCGDTRSVTVANGLFSDYMDGCYTDVNGQKLWLGVTVGSDAEMTPRQVLMPVPYALSLVPDATISGTTGSGRPILHLENWATGGRGLRAYASATSGTNYGVVGASSSPDGYGGYFFNEADGTGLHGQGSPGILGDNSGFGHGIVGRAGVFGAGVKGEGTSVGFGGLFTNTMGGIALRAESDGVALQLGGSGSIESSADSYIFVPGSALVRDQESDTTRWSIQANGAALVRRGAVTGNKYVHIPIVLPGVLYGQPVRVKSVVIYYLCSNGASSFITATDLNKQTDASSYVALVNETTNRTSNAASSYTLTLTSGNVLGSNQGILMLRLYLDFANDTDFIQIGGVRVQLGHS